MTIPKAPSGFPTPVSIRKDGLMFLWGPGPSLDDWVMYVSLEERDHDVREARASAFENEVTYWIGEHRAYLDSGMMWESELAMKNARRYGEMAKAARESVSPSAGED